MTLTLLPLSRHHFLSAQLLTLLLHELNLDPVVQELLIIGVKLSFDAQICILMHASNDLVLCRAEPLAHQLAEKLSPVEVLFTLMLSLVSLTTVVKLALIVRLLNLVERMETFSLSLEIILESGHFRL